MAMRGIDLELPHDLKAALDERPLAARRFAAMTHANRVAWCGFVEEVEEGEHRTRRIDLLIQALET